MSILVHNKEAADLLCGEIEMDEAYLGRKRKDNRGRGAAGKKLFLVYLSVMVWLRWRC